MGESEIEKIIRDNDAGGYMNLGKGGKEFQYVEIKQLASAMAKRQKEILK